MSNSSANSRPQPAQERLENLFREHHEAVLAYVRRRTSAASVDDIVAQTFLIAWRRLDQIPAGNPLPWLFRVAHNVIATEHRGAGRRHALQERLLGRLSDANGRGSQRPHSFDEQDGPVAVALARLAEKDREAITLIAWEGLRPSEAAAVLGDSPGAFRVRLHRARGRLKRTLEDTRELGLPAAGPLRAKENL